MPPESEGIIASYNTPAGVIVTTFFSVTVAVKSNKVCTRVFFLFFWGGGRLWALLLVLSVPIAPIWHSGWTVLEAPPIL